MIYFPSLIAYLDIILLVRLSTVLLTFAFTKLLHFVLIVCMVWISRSEEVEFRIIDLISSDSLLKTWTISGYKACSFINDIFISRVKEE